MSDSANPVVPETTPEPSFEQAIATALAAGAENQGNAEPGHVFNEAPKDFSAVTPPKDEAAKGGDSTAAGDPPKTETPPANPFFEKAKAELGIEAASDDDIISWVKAQKQEQATLAAKIQELEGRKIEYSSEATAKLDQYLKGKTFANEQEYLAEMQKYLEFNSKNYTDLAKSDPVSVLMDYYTKVVELDKEGAKFEIEEIANLDKGSYDQDLEDHEIEALYARNLQKLRNKALIHSRELEAKKEQFKFTPATAKTPEQAAKEAADAAESQRLASEKYISQFNEFAGVLKEIRYGDEPYGINPFGEDGKTPTKEFASAYEAANNPGPWLMKMFHNEDGSLNPAKIAETEARLSNMEAAIRVIKNNAKGAGIDEVERTLRNPGIDQAGAGSPNTGVDAHIESIMNKMWGPRRN